MKLVALFSGLLLLALAGCETISDTATQVREKVTARDESRTRTFAAAPRVVYEAVRAATSQMGYRFVRGGPAQGEFDAINSIGPGETNRSARQLALKARLHATLDGQGTDVTVRFTEILEADSTNHAGLATETPLRDTPQYEVFFRRVQQALDTGVQATK